MNKLKGTITNILTAGAIMLVDINVDGHNFSALLIESATHPEWIKVDNNIDIAFKETEVSLAKGLSGQISLRNRMKCTVLNVDRGELLSTVRMQFGKHTITSAVTTRAIDSLQINADDVVEALVKANEISLMKIVDE